jgi:hypothetical protein
MRSRPLAALASILLSRACDAGEKPALEDAPSALVQSLSN